MEDLAIELLTHLVMGLLAANGIRLPEAVVRGVVTMIVRSGVELAGVAAQAVAELGHPELAEEATEEAEEFITEVTCPINDKDVDVPIDGNNATWSCPWCKMPIVVRGDDAEHAEVLGYHCPTTGEQEYVAADSETVFRCRGCKLHVFVSETRTEYKVLHQVHLDARGGGKPRRGMVTCPVSKADVEVDEEDGTYQCLCSADIEVTRGRATHQRMLAFDCPLGETEEFVEAADGTFECTACQSDLKVYEDGGKVRIAHQLSIVD